MIHTYNKHRLLCCCSMLTVLCSIAQVKDRQVPAFEIISRSSIAAGKAGRLGLSTGNNTADFMAERKQGQPMYSVRTAEGQVSIPALSDIDYAPGGNRILVYGDSTDRHTNIDLYASLYTGGGALIRSLGKLATAPYSITLTRKGAVIVAGNSGKDPGKLDVSLSFYDAQGNRLWQAALPAHTPGNIYSAPDNQYIALALYDSEKRSNSIRYYDASGRLLFTDNNGAGVSGIEFLPSGKAVVCSGNTWYLYDLKAGYKWVSAGTLPGVGLGRYPVSAHPSKDIFFIAASNEGAKAGYTLQAYDGATGTLLAQSSFEGKPSWQPYRLAEVAADGTVRFITDREIVTLRMK